MGKGVIDLTKISQIRSNQNTVKTKHTFQGVLYLGFCCETKMGLVGVLVIFQDRPMFSHIDGKLSPRPFE